MANGGTKRSKITMNNCHLKKYFLLLCEHDLLRYEIKNNIFKTTAKGLEFLAVYNELIDCCKNSEGKPMCNWKYDSSQTY